VLNPGGPKSPYLHQVDQPVAAFTGVTADGETIGPVQASETE
jgi:hypothetical protein